jgi:hypothetical protein
VEVVTATETTAVATTTGERWKMKKKQLRKLLFKMIMAEVDDLPMVRPKKTLRRKGGWSNTTSRQLLELILHHVVGGEATQDHERILLRLENIEAKVHAILRLAQGEVEHPDYPAEPPIPSRVDLPHNKMDAFLTRGYWLEPDGKGNLPERPSSDPDGALMLGGPNDCWAIDCRLNGKPWRHNVYELNQCIHLSNIRKGRPMCFVTYNQGDVVVDRAWGVLKINNAPIDLIHSYWPHLVPTMSEEMEPEEGYVQLELAELDIDHNTGTPKWDQAEGIFAGSAKVVASSGYVAAKPADVDKLANDFIGPAKYTNEAGQLVEDDDTGNED